MKLRRKNTLPRQIVQSELAELDLQRQDRLLFVGCITAAAFVARADGWVDPAERDRLLHWMGETHLLDSFSPHDVTDMFALRLRQFEQAGGAAVAVDTLRRTVGIPRSHLVLDAAEEVATADGRLHQSEALAMTLIRRTVFPFHAAAAPLPAGFA
jgi:tellurite resistance protein